MAACADDLFCSSDEGSFFSCAAEYQTCDEEAEALARELNATKRALAAAEAASGDTGEGGSLTAGQRGGIAAAASVLGVMIIALAVAYYRANSRADAATLLVNSKPGDNPNTSFASL